MEYIFIIAIIQGLIFSFACSYIAKEKGKDQTTWAIIGFLLGIIGLLIIGFSRAEKYCTKLNTLNINDVISDVKYIDLDCPIEVRNIEIKFDEDNNLTYCAVKFFNLSNKTVNSVKFTITCYDSFGVPVGESPNNQVYAVIQDEYANPKDWFGANKNIALPNHSLARKVDIVVTNILFADKSTWEKGNNKLQELVVDKLTGVELSNIKTVAGVDAVCYAAVKDNLWTCVCGRLNKNTDDYCKRCNREKEFTLTSYSNKDAIEKMIASILEEEREERERHRNKLNKMLHIGIAILLVILIPICIIAGINHFIQLKKEVAYKEALKLLDTYNANNECDEAKKLLEGLGDYKDSKALINYASAKISFGNTYNLAHPPFKREYDIYLYYKEKLGNEFNFELFEDLQKRLASAKENLNKIPFDYIGDMASNTIYFRKDLVNYNLALDDVRYNKTQNNKNFDISSQYKNDSLDQEYLVYNNYRYGFSIDYPKDFKKGNPPTNGDGLDFCSNDGMVKLLAYGSNNLRNENLKQHYDLTLSNIKGNITYKVLENNWYVISWGDNNNIYYSKTFMGRGSLNCFIFSYPKNQDINYNSITTHINNSFKPGDINSGH